MSAKLYIETTVVSYYAARRSRNVILAGHQRTTKDFWARLGKEYEPFVSALVLEEAAQGDESQAGKRMRAVDAFPVLDITGDAQALAATLIASKAIPAEYPEDALHVAVAAVHGMDVLVTWNFSHLNNPFTRMRIRESCENAGFACPEIVSPDELLGGAP